MLKAILKLINGKEYYSISKEDKDRLRNEDYKKILGPYIVISNTFIVFGIFITAIILYGNSEFSYKSTVFKLIVVIISFITVASILMMLQKKSLKNDKTATIKYDIFINFVILFLLATMTLANIENGNYIALYAVGLVVFGLLVRIKPVIVLGYFVFILVLMYLHLKVNAIALESPVTFVVNVLAINAMIFFTSRLFFIEHLRSFLQQKKISEQNSELSDLAVKDFLTDTYNKRGFANRIKEKINYPAAICMFDLDGLKLINDAFGHERGDEAIILAADTIKEAFEGSFCSRIGGDEFVVIVENVDETKVKAMIKRFSRTMETSCKLEVLISASVGYEMMKSGDKLMEAYKRAENIMYHIKLGARSSRKNRAMEALMTALYEYTGETERHCHNVGYIAQQILTVIGYARRDDIESIKIAGYLHDIGKLSIPKEILRKDNELTKRDWEIVRLHSEESYKIACGLIDDKEIADAILYHHERWDGKGYPYNVKGEDIPLFARILSVADAYDAMLAKQNFRQVKTHEQACSELVANKESQFDPEIVDAFLKLSPEQLKI